jgi:3-oxoacyl-[acyl-carrier protein] reductase
MTELTSWFGRQATGALQGKVALITGAGRGCGKAIAQGFARASAKVCCLSRTQSEIDETVRDIGAEGGDALAIAADVSDLSSVQTAFHRAVEHFGGLDILVLSHGVALGLAKIEDTDPGEWRRTIDVNLMGAYYCMRTATPYLKSREAGKIIVLGSGQGHQGTAATSAYACSKAGTWALVQSLAAELVTFNISVNELLPGNVKTQLYDDTFTQLATLTPQGTQPLKEKRSHEWLKKPEDVVPLALFMACQPDVGPTAQSFSLMRRF